jgi:hypothetical protein
MSNGLATPAIQVENSDGLLSSHSPLVIPSLSWDRCAEAIGAQPLPQEFPLWRLEGALGSFKIQPWVWAV